MSEKYLAKIGKLLRQAEGASTEAEAAVFMAKAQELATATSIDLERARQHQASTEARKVPVQRVIHIGPRRKHGLKWYIELFRVIAANNDVKIDIAHNSTYVVAFGFESDIEVTEILYASLLTQMVEASEAYLASDEFAAETTERMNWNTYTYETKRTDKRIGRASFQEAFIGRVNLRLSAARAVALAKIDAATESSEPGTALVLANKAVEVHDFYKGKSNAHGSWSGARSSGWSSSAANAGNRAGASARLGGERAIGGHGRAIASGR